MLVQASPQKAQKLFLVSSDLLGAFKETFSFRRFQDFYCREGPDISNKLIQLHDFIMFKLLLSEKQEACRGAEDSCFQDSLGLPGHPEST